MTPPRMPDPPGLYELMQAIRAEMIGRLDRHGQQLDALSKRLTEHDEDDRRVEDRVLTIEIERRNEKEDRNQERSADRRISAVIGTAASVIFNIGKAAWNFYHPSPG